MRRGLGGRALKSAALSRRGRGSVGRVGVRSVEKRKRWVGVTLSGEGVEDQLRPGKRVEGIEPSSLAWKAIALPLSYTRVYGCRAELPAAHGRGLAADGMRLGSAGFEPAKA